MAIEERWKGHPPLPEELAERLDEMVARLRRGGAKLVYLFGSSARPRDQQPQDGDWRPGDLDLAVWAMTEDPGPVRADLEEILGTDRFDLVRLESANPELRFQVVAGGRLLHAESAELENDVELKFLREYQDTAPYRRVQRGYLRARHGVDGP